MLDRELIKDGIKIGILFIPLIYILIQTRKIITRDKRLILFVVGFLILVFGGVLDFVDEFAVFDNVFLIGANFPYHETTEDILGFIGFILFALGIVVEIRHIKKENMERKIMIEKLQEQTERLKRFDKLKSKFIEDVSHEFRSPVASISLSLSNVIEGLMGEVSQSQKSALSVGKRNLERLSRLISDLLTLSQIESGKMVFRRELNEISSLVEEAYLSLKSMFESKNVTFNNVCYLKDAKAYCDCDRIIQVFVNILSNALKYSPANEQIEVRISQEGEDIRVEIEDHGKGMSPEDLGRLFQRFEKLDIENEVGIGLGLAISREIVAMHQGKIWAESSLGKGTCFIFTIPRDLRK